MSKIREAIWVYGMAMRGDWSEVDGRDVLDILTWVSDLPDEGQLSKEEYVKLGICSEHVKWVCHCDDELHKE